MTSTETTSNSATTPHGARQRASEAVVMATNSTTRN